MDFISYYKKLEEVKSPKTPKQEFRAQIAAACGVAPSTVMRWVSGEIIPEKLKREKVSELLDISVEELWPNLVEEEE
jgi:transcriptional regulator with XRE-family HTH domain